jgi:hypothetical protein
MKSTFHEAGRPLVIKCINSVGNIVTAIPVHKGETIENLKQILVEALNEQMFLGEDELNPKDVSWMKCNGLVMQDDQMAEEYFTTPDSS